MGEDAAALPWQNERSRPRLLDTDQLEELARVADPQVLHRLTAQFRARMDRILDSIAASVSTEPMPDPAAMCHEGGGASLAPIHRNCW